MALFRKNLRQRRLEVRRNIPAQPSWFARWLGRPGAIRSLLLGVLFLLVAVALDVLPIDPFLYRRGQYVPRDIRARVTFSVFLPQKLDEARQDLRSSVNATFQLNETLVENIAGQIEKIPSQFQAAGSLEQVPVDLRTTLGIEPPAEDNANAEEIRESNDKAYQAWTELGQPDQKERLVRMVEQLRLELKACYIVRPDRAAEQQQRTAQYVTLVAGSRQVEQKVVDLVGFDEQTKVQSRVERCARTFSSHLRPQVEAFLTDRLTSEPVYVYDDAQTREDIARAVEALEANPPQDCYKVYSEGQVLAERSSRPLAEERSVKGLSEAELLLLRQEHEEYLEAEHNRRPWLREMRLAGRVVLCVLLTLLLAMYIARYQPHVLEEPYRAMTLAVLLATMLGIGKILLYVLSLNPYVALLPVCMAGVVLAIAYDQRFAMAVGSFLAAFLILQMRAGFDMMVVLLGGLMAFVFQIGEIRTRSRLLVVSTLSALAILPVVWGLSLRGGEPWPFALADSLWAVGAMILTGLIVQSLLPAIEHIFGVATGSTLLEWCDASKPLLKRLAMESPGTYNHSLQLGAMCESAAEAIGARGLLARVGAYYHDIGKINKPEYFAENQGGGENKHAKLSPAMSLLIIHGHVKDGLEMAREYGLPRVLHEFIATHHGTTLVRYFYHAAEKKSQEGQGPAPDESQFRYPGPKPHSKEAAILMLADVSESSVRAMSEPTPTRIRTQVHQMVTSRLEDGQLDECDLTLREVHQIEESLVKSLCGMYHARIAYPSEEKSGKGEKNGKTGQDEKVAQDQPASTSQAGSPPPPQAAEAGSSGSST